MDPAYKRFFLVSSGKITLRQVFLCFYFETHIRLRWNMAGRKKKAKRKTARKAKSSKKKALKRKPRKKVKKKARKKVKKKTAKKSKTRVKTVKKAKVKRKPAKKVKKAEKARKPVKKPKKRARKPKIEIILPKRLPVKPKKVVIVYGMNVNPEHITRAAIEAYNKRRYTVHDIKLSDYIPDPKFRNLMVKIAVLDRIEEELLRLYPNTDVIRPNTVTLMVR
ncbi:MAG: hypothetical protein GF414_04275 [Candidatus Altiarchaeales archaeon]|nr:hypothetical protein [Candidatus Altiarchaeales archaeon]